MVKLLNQALIKYIHENVVLELLYKGSACIKSFFKLCSTNDSKWTQQVALTYLFTHLRI